jgi:deazaflavin-dependent oxidoreductase (nitroreductase family)
MAMQTVILTTTGRRSGEPRDVKLYAFNDSDRIVLVGSAGGGPEDPAWVRNLRADPRARLRVGKRELEVLAVEADGAEHEQLFAAAVAAFRWYGTYQRKTTRRITVFVLTTVQDA